MKMLFCRQLLYKTKLISCCLLHPINRGMGQDDSNMRNSVLFHVVQGPRVQTMGP